MFAKFLGNESFHGVAKDYEEWRKGKDFSHSAIRFMGAKELRNSVEFQVLIGKDHEKPDLRSEFVLQMGNNTTGKIQMICKSIIPGTKSIQHLANNLKIMIDENAKAEYEKYISRRNRVNASDWTHFLHRLLMQEWNAGILVEVWNTDGKKKKGEEPKFLSRSKSNASYEDDDGGWMDYYSDDDEVEWDDDDEEDDDGDDLKDHDGGNRDSGFQDASKNRTMIYETVLQMNRSNLVYDFSRLEQEQRQSINHIVEVFGLSRGAAGILLRHAGWDAKVLENEYRGNEEGLSKEAGVPPPPLSHVAFSLDDSFQIEYLQEVRKLKKLPKEKVPFTCQICFGEFKDLSETVAMSCLHRFCRDCWVGYLKMGLNSGAAGDRSVLSLKCPGLNKSDDSTCERIIDQDVFEAMLDRSNYEKYLHILFLSYVNENESFIWCPRPGCENALYKNPNMTDAQCSCDQKLCLLCGRVSHAPCNCEQAEQWLQAVDEHLETLRKKREESGGNDNVTVEQDPVKLCPNPKCRVPTTKNGGCMHVICSTCNTEYCWQCGQWGGGDTGRERPHHVYDCNVPPVDGWGSAVPFEDDGRFQFYYERYTNHRHSLKVAENKKNTMLKTQLEKIGPKLLENEIKYLPDAFDLLIDSRNMLSWTFVYAFFIEDDKKRVLFQYVQNDLEQRVEDFTPDIEQENPDILLKSRLEIMNKTRAIRKYFDNVMEWEAQNH